MLHGTIWDEANEKAKELVRSQGLTYVHPFDDEQLIAGQGTLGLEIVQDWPEVDAVIVPIGGGGLISGVSMAVKSHNPKARVIGVESSDGTATAMPQLTVTHGCGEPPCGIISCSTFRRMASATRNAPSMSVSPSSATNSSPP